MTRSESMILPQPVSEKMQCMEVWGGNRSTWSQFSVPGLDLWIHSEPYRSNNAGGDVYYLSSCASGRITRMLLADVSGHGASVGTVAVELRDLMRKNINFVSQSHLVKSLNEEFESISEEGAFATASVSTFLPSKDAFTLQRRSPHAFASQGEHRSLGTMGRPQRNANAKYADRNF